MATTAITTRNRGMPGHVMAGVAVGASLAKRTELWVGWLNSEWVHITTTDWPPATYIAANGNELEPSV